MSRRKEFRTSVVALQDGFSGTADIDDASIVAEDGTLLIDSATLDLHDDVTIVPVGVRFTTPAISTIRTVTAQNNSMVWTVTVDATSGNFTLTFEGQTTANIAEGAAASAVQSALEALSNVAPGDLLVTGSSGGPFTVTAAATYANESGLVLTATDVDLMGGGDTVTVATVEDGLSTWQLTFTPVLASGSLPTTGQEITFLPQRLNMKVGESNFEFTVNKAPIFDLDRGLLDGVRAGNQVPMDVSTGFVFNFLRASSGQPMTPYEALMQEGEGANWHNAADDPCEPYCVDVVLIDTPDCGSEEAEVMIFPKFNLTSLGGNVETGLVTLQGKCNALKPTITREAV